MPCCEDVIVTTSLLAGTPWALAVTLLNGEANAQSFTAAIGVCEAAEKGVLRFLGLGVGAYGPDMPSLALSCFVEHSHALPYDSSSCLEPWRAYNSDGVEPLIRSGA